MRIRDLDPQALDELLADAAAPPVLLDLWAPWCAPCRAQAPALKKLAVSAEGLLQVAKLDVQEHPGVNEKLGIRGIPTLVLFKGGREAARRSGVQTLAELRQWLVGEGVPVGDGITSAAEGDAPLGGAFHGDTGLRDFLVARLLEAAARGRVAISRFPYWIDGKGTVSAVLVQSQDIDVFQQVTGLPAGVGMCLEFADLARPADIEEVFALILAGGDFREVPARMMRAWLSDAQWTWREFLGEAEDDLRQRWVDACAGLLSGAAPAASTWLEIRQLAESLQSSDPQRTLQQHFLRMLAHVTPPPLADDKVVWATALLGYGTYLMLSRGNHDVGWRAQDFAVETIQHAWFMAHCPNPREKTREEMDALHSEFERAHVELLAAHEPKLRRARDDYELVHAPFVARLRAHLVSALRRDGVA